MTDYGPAMELGDRLRRMRMERNMSLADTEAAMKIGKSTYRNWEQGMAVPNLLMAKRVAEAFGITLDSLVEGINDGNS